MRFNAIERLLLQYPMAAWFQGLLEQLIICVSMIVVVMETVCERNQSAS